MDELDRPGDSHELDLVARLRAEPVPADGTTARHHSQLVAVIQTAKAVAAPSVEVDVEADEAEDVDPGVVRLARASADEERRRPRRLLATAAAVAAIAGGLVAAGRLAPDSRDDTVAGESPTPCGNELPLSFPVPSGFEGPFPGPSGEVTDPPDPPDAFQQHWRRGEVTIDVRWPSTMGTDHTTPPPAGVTERELDDTEPAHAAGGRHSLREAFRTEALGTGVCSGLEVALTSADVDASEDVLDHIEVALLGPGGPLVTGRPLVIGSTTGDAVPAIEEPSSCPGTVGGFPNDGAPTHPTARDALGSYVASNPLTPLDGYVEIALPDGSFAYTYDSQPDFTAGVVHVMPSVEGWRVAWEATRC